jgi:hypothetical protein
VIIASVRRMPHEQLLAIARTGEPVAEQEP